MPLDVFHYRGPLRTLNLSGPRDVERVIAQLKRKTDEMRKDIMNTSDFREAQLSVPVDEPQGVPPVLDRMKHERSRLQSRLRELDAAINAMETNPPVAAVINAISKLGHV